MCDLSVAFMLMKSPDEQLAKCTVAQFETYVGLMHNILEPFLVQGKVDITKRALFIDSMALLFHVTLPYISEKHIQGKWEIRGLLPRPSLDGIMRLLEAPGIFTEEMKEVYLQHETELVTYFVVNGFVSDKLLDKYFPPSQFSLDDVALRSQRIVILTHAGTILRVVARRDAPRLRKEQRERERKEKQEEDERLAKVCHSDRNDSHHVIIVLTKCA